MSLTAAVLHPQIIGIMELLCMQVTKYLAGRQIVKLVADGQCSG
jgi:hypothetical protein